MVSSSMSFSIESVIRSYASEYCGTSEFRPVKLNRSRMKSSSISQKNSEPFRERNHSDQSGWILLVEERDYNICSLRRHPPPY
jgi:hypothetical protein